MSFWQKSATLLKVTLLHGCFPRFLYCINGNKWRKALYICKFWNIYQYNLLAWNKLTAMLRLSTEKFKTLLGVSITGNLKYLQTIKSQTFWVQLLLRAIVHRSTVHQRQYGTQLLLRDDWTHNMYLVRWTDSKTNHIWNYTCCWLRWIDKNFNLKPLTRLIKFILVKRIGIAFFFRSLFFRIHSKVFRFLFTLLYILSKRVISSKFFDFLSQYLLCYSWS